MDLFDKLLIAFIVLSMATVLLLMGLVGYVAFECAVSDPGQAMCQ